MNDVPRNDAREQVVAAADRRAHDHAQLLALVERGDVGLRVCRRGTAEQQANEQQALERPADEQRGRNDPHAFRLSRLCHGERLGRDRRLEQPTETAARLAPADEPQRVPDHRLVAGDDAPPEPPLQLRDDAED